MTNKWDARIEQIEQENTVCKLCHQYLKKTAHHTGDGWYLSLECTNSECENHYKDGQEIEWPFGNVWLNASDLKSYGYEVV